MTNTLKKGFTLVELLIVIAVLAILIAAVIIVLNPGEILAQARDSQRVNDLASLKNSLNLFIIQTGGGSPELGSCPNVGRCTGTPAAGKSPFTKSGPLDCATVVDQTVNGSGWMDVKFSDLPGGSPVPFLPLDPRNGETYYYAYACKETPDNVFELDGRLESAKYRNLMTTDGGDKNDCGTDWGTGAKAGSCFYEIGTKPGLDM